jgi:hypothetical protein
VGVAQKGWGWTGVLWACPPPGGGGDARVRLASPAPHAAPRWVGSAGERWIGHCRVNHLLCVSPRFCERRVCLVVGVVWAVCVCLCVRVVCVHVVCVRERCAEKSSTRRGTSRWPTCDGASWPTAMTCQRLCVWWGTTFHGCCHPSRFVFVRVCVCVRMRGGGEWGGVGGGLPILLSLAGWLCQREWLPGRAPGGEIGPGLQSPLCAWVKQAHSVANTRDSFTFDNVFLPNGTLASEDVITSK